MNFPRQRLTFETTTISRQKKRKPIKQIDLAFTLSIYMPQWSSIAMKRKTNRFVQFDSIYAQQFSMK